LAAFAGKKPTADFGAHGFCEEKCRISKAAVYAAPFDTARIVCHCRDCQKFTGSAFAFVLGAPKTAVNVQGALKKFVSPGDSGNLVIRQFCPDCGSSIAEETSNRPGLMIINCGTLDDPTSVTPARELYCERALAWVQLVGMQRFSKMPV
jgi:hypothetical protein